jgi:hypothetical protein
MQTLPAALNRLEKAATTLLPFDNLDNDGPVQQRQCYKQFS